MPETLCDILSVCVKTLRGGGLYKQNPHTSSKDLPHCVRWMGSAVTMLWAENIPLVPPLAD